MKWLIYIGIGLGIIIVLSMLGKAMTGLQGIWRILCSPFIVVYQIVKFIFKK